MSLIYKGRDQDYSGGVKLVTTGLALGRLFLTTSPPPAPDASPCCFLRLSRAARQFLCSQTSHVSAGATGQRLLRSSWSHYTIISLSLTNALRYLFIF